MGNSKSKTIKAKKINEEVNELFDMNGMTSSERIYVNMKGKKQLQGTLKANLKATLKQEVQHWEAVKLPPEHEEEEWISLHVLHFLRTTEKVYKICEPFCSELSCPKMNAGAKYTFLWADNPGDKAVQVCANEYIQRLFVWVHDQTNDQDLFPLEEKEKFPRNFRRRVNDIYRRLFRVYAHIYHSHLEQMQEKGAEEHLNSSFKYFVFFADEFSLLDKSNFDPLGRLVEQILRSRV